MEPQKQKQALRRLIAVGKLISLEHFFSINITHWGKVSLQGNFNREVVKWAIANKFFVSVNKTLGYIEFTRGNIDIILT